MVAEFRVEFLKVEYKNGSRVEVKTTGVVKDRYRGITTIKQDAPSGKGGTVELRDFKINVDFYLILGADGNTYRIKCDDVNLPS